MCIRDRLTTSNAAVDGADHCQWYGAPSCPPGIGAHSPLVPVRMNDSTPGTRGRTPYRPRSRLGHRVAPWRPRVVLLHGSGPQQYRHRHQQRDAPERVQPRETPVVQIASDSSCSPSGLLIQATSGMHGAVGCLLYTSSYQATRSQIVCPGPWAGESPESQPRRATVMGLSLIHI